MYVFWLFNAGGSLWRFRTWTNNFFSLTRVRHGKRRREVTKMKQWDIGRSLEVRGVAILVLITKPEDGCHYFCHIAFFRALRVWLHWTHLMIISVFPNRCVCAENFLNIPYGFIIKEVFPRKIIESGLFRF